MKKQKKNLNLKNAIKLFLAWSGMLLFLILGVYLVKENAIHFQASIMPTVQAPAYDGLVMPVEKAPNWVALTSEEYKMSYNQIPASKIQKIPVYDPSKLTTPVENLKWGNPADDAIRNMKITYSVPYMGNYKLDGTEYGGSHPAIDIKVPMDTPVYAIGNGVVVKKDELSSGFGKHIVIQHKDFPSFENPNTKATYYSSYSHLNSIVVTENTVVKKGQLIGYVGSTGFSTTPHLHFQIDKPTAQWYPYWPFTSKEASDAGHNFTQAVNTGFNQSKAIANTIHPLMYVQKYQSGTVSGSTTYSPPPPQPTTPTTTTISSTTTSTTNTVSPSTTVPSTNSNNTPTNQPGTPYVPETDHKTVTLDENAFKSIFFEIIGDDTFKFGEDKIIRIRAKDRAGSTVANYDPPTPVRISTMQGSAQFSKTQLGRNDFVNGIATVTMTPRNENPIQFIVKSDYVMVESKIMTPGVFVDISMMHPNFQAISFLKNEGVIQGYPDGSFKPLNKISRVEVLKLILEGIKADIQTARNLPFSDTDIKAWYADYLATAYSLKIAQGYPDNTFKPAATVNKVEFLKMLVEAMNIDINPEVNDLGFVDVNNNDWYAPYVMFATEKNIIDVEGNRFNPNEKLDRAAVAEAIYRVQLLTKTGAGKYTADLINQINDQPA